MNRWFLLDPRLMNSAKVQRLSAKEYRAAFEAALEGRESPFSEFVKGPYIRPLSHEWKVIRTRIFERDDFTCTYCGVRGVKLECDHIVPVAKGGGHDDANLTTACRPCNRSKAAKDLSQVLKEWHRD